MVKKILIIVCIAVVAFVVTACAKKSSNTNGYSALDIATGTADIKIKEKADKDLAIAKAKELWRIQFQIETDLSQGPCLSNTVIPDWAADIAHNPRQAVDEDPANQCVLYRAGSVHHFVELDPEGNLIRAE
ncbi:MAG: hypothetical protein PHY34_00675 [Patescibacteria group bacterium]|nr:hypothetical protein [Patescibacteria group bacterium]MDD5715857.1 hypothetical protein [Patescibacteria group bacterium]